MYFYKDEPATAAYTLKRRSLLTIGGLAIASSLSPLSAFARARHTVGSAPRRPVRHRKKRQPRQPGAPQTTSVSTMQPLVGVLATPALEKSVTLYHVDTSERLQTVYWFQDEYLPEALQKINYLLRDHHTNEMKAIDPQLLDLLYDLSRLLDTNEPFHVLSGYRSPATNARLHRLNSRVASNSLHLVGKAADIYLPGRQIAVVRRAAMALQAGGVGYYSRKDALHVDTGPVRYW